MKSIIGKKIEMSQIFENDKVIPVTLIEVAPCVITQVKTQEKDGYSAVQVGLEKKTRKIKKSEKGKEYKYLRELPLTDQDKELKIGDSIDASVFQEGDTVKVSSVSKGKGFQGAVKRWGFHGRNATHGVKHEHRTIGSAGATDPARVFPGKKMPGRMGGERVSVKNLKIAKVDKENNLIAIKGAVPGRRGALVEIRG